METRYLLWEIDGVPDDDREEDGRHGQNRKIVRIYQDGPGARTLAEQEYLKEGTNMLVVEVRTDGTSRPYAFVGEVTGKHCSEYGSWSVFCSRECGRAVAAAIVVLMSRVEASEV